MPAPCVGHIKSLSMFGLEVSRVLDDKGGGANESGEWGSSKRPQAVGPFLF